MGKDEKAKTSRSAGCGPVYGLGMIGAIVWTWQQADGVGEHLVGILQSLVWPAFVVYDLLDALHR